VIRIIFLVIQVISNKRFVVHTEVTGGATAMLFLHVGIPTRRLLGQIFYNNRGTKNYFNQWKEIFNESLSGKLLS
jgi:hypothetical protein